jgi:tetratricopeptide (TPR) repeat protein
VTASGPPTEATGTLDAALGHARRLLQTDPALAATQAAEILAEHPPALQILGLALAASGDRAGADAAWARQIQASTRDPGLLAAARELRANRLPEAERLLKTHLSSQPTDVAAMRMLAEVAGRLGRYQDAEHLLARCLELAPGFDAARHNYALALHRQNKSAAALAEVTRLAERDPHNHGHRNLKAVILAKIGEYRESIETYARVLEGIPDNPKLWLSYGHALASAGRETDAIAAYRRALALAPGFGEAYWSLANLKTFRFTEAESGAMQVQLGRGDLDDADRFHFHFALGKALEDGAAYEPAFAHYLSGNRLRRAGISYDADETTTFVRRSKTLFTAGYFASRAGFGDDAPDPIFIVGLPRSGSTLIEQILASHSAVEGTMELPDVIAIAQALGGKRRRTDESKYPAVLADLDAAQCRSLGRQYLEQTRIQRRTGKPLFIDKMPNNFLHIGLIHQMLPAAKIVDARRHPLACCFSAFKQHFARGQHFTYDLEDLGRYYRDYTELMAHFDSALPGRIHRVHYETMVGDTEAEIRRLLDYCGLPFEESCLRFHQNERAVRTASRQQVRRPIFREGIDHWRNFDAWLGPLKQALGPAYSGKET